MSDDWIESMTVSTVSAIRDRLVVVHASMDVWERDFLAALEDLVPLSECDWQDS